MRLFPVLLILTSLFCFASEPSVKGDKLFVYCAAGMRKPIEILAKNYESKKGTKIELTYDGSNKLLGQIKLTHKGDIYIAGDADYIEMARKDSLVNEGRTICYFIPIIMVKKGNPKKITGLNDLIKPGIKLGQGDDKAAAVGRILPEILRKNGVDSIAWRKNILLSTPTVNELGIAVKLGTIDAAIVWNAIAAAYQDVSEPILIPAGKNVIPQVGAAVLNFSKSKTEAAAFLNYLTSQEAKEELRKEGYTTENPVE